MPVLGPQCGEKMTFTSDAGMVCLNLFVHEVIILSGLRSSLKNNGLLCPAMGEFVLCKYPPYIYATDASAIGLSGGVNSRFPPSLPLPDSCGYQARCHDDVIARDTPDNITFPIADDSLACKV
jgi:hypothetical protein